MTPINIILLVIIGTGILTIPILLIIKHNRKPKKKKEEEEEIEC